jgi:hypothetical protein
VTDQTFMARDKFDEAVEFRRNGDKVEYRYTAAKYAEGGNGRWREPTWERDCFTDSEQRAYDAACLAPSVVVSRGAS